MCLVGMDEDPSLWYHMLADVPSWGLAPFLALRLRLCGNLRRTITVRSFPLIYSLVSTRGRLPNRRLIDCPAGYKTDPTGRYDACDSSGLTDPVNCFTTCWVSFTAKYVLRAGSLTRVSRLCNTFAPAVCRTIQNFAASSSKKSLY